jgi:hypothetical protein
MNSYLVGLGWCDPEEVRAYVCAGLDDDARCSTGIFVIAKDKTEALSWGTEVCKKYMGYLFAGKIYRLEELEIFCWVEEDPQKSRWKHCLDFFQKVHTGQAPEFPKMTVEAYVNWCKKAGIS